MRGIIPITINTNEQPYASLKWLIVDQRAGFFWYCLFLLWLLSMIAISMVTLAFIFTVDDGLVPTIAGGILLQNPQIENVMSALGGLFRMFINISGIYIFVGLVLDCGILPYLDYKKEWL